MSICSVLISQNPPLNGREEVLSTNLDITSIALKSLYATACTRVRGNREELGFLTLSGETELHEISISDTPLALIDNINTSQKIVEYAQKVVLFSPTYPSRSKIIQEFINSTSANEVNLYLENIGDNFAEIKSKCGIHPAQRAQIFRAGNCSEMASIGLEFAKSKHLTDNIEKFCIFEGDHVFLVIGRDLESDPSDYKSWGENAVVCDPWSGAYYPATLLEEHLKDYKGLCKLPGGVWECEMDRFNPEKQQVILAPSQSFPNYSIPLEEEQFVQDFVSDLSYILGRSAPVEPLFLTSLFPTQVGSISYRNLEDGQ